MQSRKSPAIALHVAVCAALGLANAPAPAQTPPAPRPPAAVSNTSAVPAVTRNAIEVKFRESTQVRLRGGQLQATSGTARAGNLSMLRTMQADSGPIANIRPLFSGGETALDGMATGKRLRSGGTAPNLNQWYIIQLNPGTNLQRVIDTLKAMPEVETAYPAPTPAELPQASPSPDLTSFQVYGHPAAFYGTDASHAKTIEGGRGENVRVLDIEYGWNLAHEDLSKLRRPEALVPLGIGTPFYSPSQEHGTSVFGVITGDENSFGVTGLVPDAEIRALSPLYVNADGSSGYNPAAAVVSAAQVLRPGDVILLEQQYWSGCSDPGGNDYVPIEVLPSVYDAVVTATANGVHVVEAGGNGNVNLDTSCVGGGGFPSGKPDSGAIIVGAGNIKYGPALSRASFSSYGSRVNLQGWGDWSVTTTGTGPIGAPDANRLYTHQFSGTSSASPIVASAVAAISSIAKERGIDMSPVQLRDLLIRTGTPQAQPGTGHIGPMPNLKAAITAMGGSALCPALANKWSGRLDQDKKSEHSYPLQMVRAGRIRACLVGPADSNFDLYLERRTQGNTWETLVSATSLTSSEPLSYDADAGMYRFRLVARQGKGFYNFGYLRR